MKNNDEKLYKNCSICTMMSTTTLQNLKLKFNLCSEKQKRQIVLRGEMNQLA
jgi:hypothetical protein